MLTRRNVLKNLSTFPVGGVVNNVSFTAEKHSFPKDQNGVNFFRMSAGSYLKLYF